LATWPQHLAAASWKPSRKSASAPWPRCPTCNQRQALAVDLTARQAVYLLIVDDAGEAREAANDADHFAEAGLVLEMEGVDDDPSE
jgi:hypothetical protein